MSFYNTYRPKVLEEIDNGSVRKIVASLLTKKRDQIPHAYLLTGPRGTGKTTTARILAKLFNCTKPTKTGEPCGTCEMCIAIGSGQALDILEIDAASNTGVDNIRDLKDKMMLAPSRAEYKVYIIDEVHMLSTGAFNALLKTLEEPPAKTVFILATTDLHKVPTTIQSRCHMISFQKPKIEEIVGALKRITSQEKIAIDDALLNDIASHADGSFRDATKLLEEATLRGNNAITKPLLEEILSLPKDAEMTQFLENLKSKNAGKLIMAISMLQGKGTDIKPFYQAVISSLQKELVDLVVVDTKQSIWSKEELVSLLSLLHKRYVESRNTNFPELPLQLAILEYCLNATPVAAPLPRQPVPAVTAPISKPIEVSVVAKPSSEAKEIPQKPAPPQSGIVALHNGEVTTERVLSHWKDVIDEMKALNHSIAGVLRSVQPHELKDNVLTIQTQYVFHKDKLSEPKAKEALSNAMKKLFGVDVSVEILLIKK